MPDKRITIELNWCAHCLGENYDPEPSVETALSEYFGESVSWSVVNEDNWQE